MYIFTVIPMNYLCFVRERQVTKSFTLFLQEMDDDAFEKKYNTMGVDLLRAQELYCREVLKLFPGQMAVISNGRVRL